MNDATHIQPMDELDGFVRIPGVFRRSEIEQVLRPGCDFHIQPERLAPGTHLFTVYRQEIEDVAPALGAELEDRDEADAGAARWPPSGGPPRELPPLIASRPRLEATSPSTRPERPPPIEKASLGEVSLGEIRAQHREDHLCLRCSHHLVCGMAKALDPNLLVTIAHCLGFEPAADDSHFACEPASIDPLVTR